MWWPSLRLNSEDTLKRRKNPYTQRLKKQVTLRLGVDGIELYLRECAHTGRKGGK
jgi:hypothetical protein